MHGFESPIAPASARPSSTAIGAGARDRDQRPQLSVAMIDQGSRHGGAQTALQPGPGTRREQHDVGAPEVHAEALGGARRRMPAGERVEEVADAVALAQLLDQLDLADRERELVGDRPRQVDGVAVDRDQQPDEVLVGDQRHRDRRVASAAGELRPELRRADRLPRGVDGARRRAAAHPQDIARAVDEVDQALAGGEQLARAIGDRPEQLVDRVGGGRGLAELREVLELPDPPAGLGVKARVLDGARHERAAGDEELDL